MSFDILITSGGTNVPIDPVRYIANFSTGQRGAKLAEYFLKEGKRVLFIHSKNSLLPFYLPQSDPWKIDEINTITRQIDYCHLYRNQIEFIEYNTVEDYLNIIHNIIPIKYSSIPLWIMASAVSDFELNQSHSHKIQSKTNESHLQLSLRPVLKKPINTLNAVLVMFKLETQEDILFSKMEECLTKYRANIVIGNILENRRNECFILMEEIHSKLIDDSGIFSIVNNHSILKVRRTEDYEFIEPLLGRALLSIL